MDLQEIRQALQDRNISAVSRNTGISRETIYRLLRGEVEHKYSTVKTLSDYLQAPLSDVVQTSQQGGAENVQKKQV